LSIYPEFDWVVWKFKIVPHGFWNDNKKQRKFFNWIGTQLGFKSFEDWYNITHRDIIKHGGRALLSYYNNSPMNAVLSIYRDFDWLVWKFNFVPIDFWKEKKNQRKYFDWVGKQLGFKSFEDWYNITKEDIDKYRGTILLQQHFNNSPVNALLSIYIDFDWAIWKFNEVSNRFWTHNDHKHDGKFLCDIGNIFHISNKDEWYRVSSIEVD